MEVKLCPFCGSIPYVDDQDDVRGGGYVPDDCSPIKCFEIGCKKCDVHIVRDTQEIAIAAWNARHERESSKPHAYLVGPNTVSGKQGEFCPPPGYGFDGTAARVALWFRSWDDAVKFANWFNNGGGDPIVDDRRRG